jgi:hypothetical protein
MDEIPSAPPTNTPAKKRGGFWLPGFGRGWLWLVYLDLLLPGLLWSAAYFLSSPALARLFHNYGLYVMSTAPVGADGTLFFLSLSGVTGLLIHVYAAARGILRRDRLDAALCLVFAVAMFVVFFLGLNYDAIRILEFTGLPSL